jgi:hypothetical protein
MKTMGIFPFGQPVQDLVQKDRTPKKVFVLGVYASAVHAKWIDADGKIVVRALAVASEPTIFWRGENAEPILNQINIPKELGKILPAEKKFNGPSGLALDQLVLHPLGLDRPDVWLCDLVPHSCVNPKQQAAIERAYEPNIEKFGLPKSTVPTLPAQLTDANRRKAILDEVLESEASVLVLLGDLPIKWFLTAFDKRWKKLVDFGAENDSYGKLHEIELAGKSIQLLPLCHPRQSARLGASSEGWYQLHTQWMAQTAKDIAKGI